MPRTKQKLTRAEKGELTRRNLLAAAVKVVGEHGYGGASVTSITARARIAQGTFYNYFESRQDILDQVLPELGEVLLDYLGARAGSTTFLEREERSLRAYFDFVRQHPEFYRVLLEAQVHSPGSYAEHVQNLTRNYIRALRKNKANGFLQSYSDEELETLAVILLGARVQMMGQYCFRKGRVSPIPEHVIETFMKFLATGFGSPGAPLPKRRQATRRAAEPRGWYSATVADASGHEGAFGHELTVRYEIAVQTSDVHPPDPDRALQELVADLLHRAATAVSPTAARVRGNNLLLFARGTLIEIEATCRIDAANPSELVASYVLLDSTNESASRLASGQAVLEVVSAAAI